MLGVNALVGSKVQLKYQSNLKTDTAYNPDAAKSASKPAPSVAAAADAVVAAPKIDAPRIDPKPVDLFAGSFAQIFNNFDADGNGLVTRDEIMKTLQANGSNDKDAQAFADNVLSDIYDTNGDGLSMVELNRRLKVDSGDAFAAYDLNSDGKIGTDESEEAMKRFSAAGWKIDANHVRSVIANADIDDNKILTKAEFDNFNKYGRPTKDTHAFEVIFNQFDADGDGIVTRDEAMSILKSQGADEKSAEAFLANVFSSDLDGDGAISIPELRSRIFADTGKVFERLDTNYNNEVTAEELKQVIAEYVKNGFAIDPDDLRKKFAEMDTDKNGILSRAEFAAFNSKTSDAAADVADVKPDPAKPVVLETAVDAVQTTSVDAITKPEIPKISPAMIDAQLLLLLQDKA